MTITSRIVLAWVLPLAWPGLAAAGKPPKDAPVCAAPGTQPLFVAPMGQPFRAGAGQAYPSRNWFTAADRDGDGGVSRAELVADADRFFTRLDRDGDGRLVPEEVAAYERTVAPEIALYAPRGHERGDRRDDDGYDIPQGAGRYAWLNIPEPVAAADGDLDRIVTRAEFAQAAARRFDQLDLARTGALRPGAMPRTPQQAAIEGPCRPPKRRTVRPDPLDQLAPAIPGAPHP